MAKTIPQILLVVLCVILMVIGILLCLLRGIIGIVLGVLTCLIALIGFYGGWTRSKIALRIFWITTLILGLLVLASLLLLILDENASCNDNPFPFNPVFNDGTNTNCAGIASYIIDAIALAFYGMSFCLSVCMHPRPEVE